MLRCPKGSFSPSLAVWLAVGHVNQQVCADFSDIWYGVLGYLGSHGRCLVLHSICMGSCLELRIPTSNASELFGSVT